MTGNAVRGAAIALTLGLLVPVAGARAADGRVMWPTFFRLGPNKQGRVVQELLRGTVVDVRTCDGQWCQVQYGRTLGYVERATLNADPFPPRAAPAQSDCFDAVRSGYGKGEDWRYCPR